MKKFAALLMFVVLCAGADSPIDYEDYKAIRAAAQKGDANAQYNMVVMYDRGYKVKQDHKEAMKWYKLAADQGVPSAQYNLGTMYVKGEGVEVNYSEAEKYYTLAA